MILDERRNNVDALRESVEQDVAQLNGDQRLGAAFDALCGAVMSGAGGVFLLEGFGGTGKTFLINLILQKVRPEGGIALPTASSGTATTLLDGSFSHRQYASPFTNHVSQ